MSRIFKNFSISFFIFFISGIGFAGGDDISVLQEELDMILTDEYNPCFDQLEGDISDDSNITSVIQLSGIGSFSQGDEIMSSSNVKAIVESYDPITNQITYYQTAKTGLRSFSIGDKLVGESSDVLTIEEFVLDFVVPCSDLVVSIEEDPEQMIFVFADSEAARQAKLAAKEMMAEIETEMARQAALEAFQEKLEAEKAAAARSTAIYQARLQQEQMIKDRQAQLALERELAAFEAQLEADLAKEASEKAFKEFYAEFLANKAAQEAVEREIAEFEAEFEEQQARLREQMALEQELAAFEAQLEADLAKQAAELAAAEMMAEIIAEEERAKRLAEFQAKLEAEKAAAAASTAAYQAKVAYDARIDKILQDLVVKLEEVMTPDDYKSILVEELIEEATAKLEEEKFIGAISGEIVTVAIHEFCKDNLNLSDSNIELFKKALAGGYLGNVGPQIDVGTEFTANRWDKYITCVGSKGD